MFVVSWLTFSVLTLTRPLQQSDVSMLQVSHQDPSHQNRISIPDAQQTKGNLWMIQRTQAQLKSLSTVSSIMQLPGPPPLKPQIKPQTLSHPQQ